MYITLFLQNKLLQRDFSIQSISAYRSDLSHFNGYLQTNLKLSFEEVDLNIIETYVAQLSDSGFKPSAISRKISVIRQFYKYLYQQKIIKQNPTRFLKSPKFYASEIHPLSVQQIQNLINSCDNFDFPHNLRLRAMIELAFGAGLRVTELVSLLFEAINHDRDYAIITGKGKKERMIPLTGIIKQALKEYTPHRLFFSKDPETPFLFPSNGKQGYLTRIRFFQLLKQLALYANIDPKHISPHIFRHSFALSMLRGGADLHSLQSLLGHKNIDTVEVYTKINNDDLWDMVNVHHPLIDLKN